MGKSKKATRKQLEEVLVNVIQDLEQLKKFFAGVSNYMGAYIQFKGDTLPFNDYLEKEIKNKEKTTSQETKVKDIKSGKKDRYKKVSTPPL